MACLRHREVTALESGENNIPFPTEEELDEVGKTIGILLVRDLTSLPNTYRTNLSAAL